MTIIAGCTTGNVSPTQEATKPPQDVATAVGTGPDPNATEPSARPTETASANLPTATPEVQIGYGGPLSEQAIKDIEAGKYVSQIEGTTEWANYWYPNGLVGKEVNLGFLEDQNGQLMAGIDGGDYWLFPPVVNGEPAYQGAPAPGTPLAENFDPFRVNKVITEQQALDQGYSPEMAKFLAGTAVELRSGMLARVRDGKAIAYVGEQSRRWEKLQEFPLATTQESAQNMCRIGDPDLNNWLRYGMLNDTTGRFSDQVIHWPLDESSMLGGPSAGTHVYWAATEQDTNPRNQFADPNTRPTKRVAFCTIDRGGWVENVRIVKYLNPSGHVSWYMLRGIGGGDPARYDDFPVIEWKMDSALPLNDPETIRLLREWVGSRGESDFPKQLEKKLLYEIN
jgi:hypothetical protein